jgi:HlyD family secretion protein
MMRLLLGCAILLSAALVPVAKADEVRLVGALARIEPKDRIYSIAPPSSAPEARIKKLLVSEGNRVQAGDVLAVLDVEDVRRAERDLAVATLRSSEARLQVVRNRLERRQALKLKADIVSQESLEEVRSDFLVAQAELAEAQARLEKAEILLQEASVRAPTDGVVLYVHVREGEFAAMETGILDLADVEQMMAVAEVYETDIRHIAVGQQAEFRSGALREPVTGRVERIQSRLERATVTAADPTRNSETRVMKVHIALDDSERMSRFINLQGEAIIQVEETKVSEAR